MSKGSTPRPYSVDQKTFDNNWDTIFKKQKVDEQDAVNAYNDERLVSRFDKESLSQENIKRTTQVGASYPRSWMNPKTITLSHIGTCMHCMSFGPTCEPTSSLKGG